MPVYDSSRSTAVTARNETETAIAKTIAHYHAGTDRTARPDAMMTHTSPTTRKICATTRTSVPNTKQPGNARIPHQHRTDPTTAKTPTRAIRISATNPRRRTTSVLHRTYSGRTALFESKRSLSGHNVPAPLPLVLTQADLHDRYFTDREAVCEFHNGHRRKRQIPCVPSSLRCPVPRPFPPSTLPPRPPPDRTVAGKPTWRLDESETSACRVL